MDHIIHLITLSWQIFMGNMILASDVTRYRWHTKESQQVQKNTQKFEYENSLEVCFYISIILQAQSFHWMEL